MFTLSWQLPHDWPWMLGFLAARAVEGVETVGKLDYIRSLPIGGHRGLVRVVPDLHANMLHVTLSTGLQPVASECLARITHLSDLGCCPQQIITALDNLGAARPGLHLSGCVDASEQGVRAILGQLVSVLMTAKLTAKVAHAYGETLGDAPECVCFPTPKAPTNVDPLHLKALGMLLKCAEALIHLTHAMLEGALAATTPTDIGQGTEQLQTFPGIGHQTTSYFALRGWQVKDVSLPGDYLIRQRFPGMTPAQVQRYAECWKPWRSYALLHI